MPADPDPGAVVHGFILLESVFCSVGGTACMFVALFMLAWLLATMSKATKHASH